MIEKIQNELGLNFKDIEKVDIKGKFLIKMKTGEMKEIPLKGVKKFARPSCQYCGDFSAELADISCGRVGLDGWTYTVIRTDEGSEVFDDAMRKGLIKVGPSEKFQFSTKLLLKLSKRKRDHLEFMKH